MIIRTGDHLRAGADPAKKRILGVRRVTGQNDTVDAQRDNAEGVEYANIQIRDHHLLLADTWRQ